MVRTMYGGKAAGAFGGALSKTTSALSGVTEALDLLQGKARSFMAGMHARLACRSGQGTTEYAILVGVLVVIAIVAITVFRPKIEELWNAIADGINGL
ncbi:MAG: hypothetical protein Q4B69_03060 [Slackia sp.]|nr:hypothetical protein [Slackia sp.]